MKYFLDFEFIEGFHKPLFGRRRHFIDLISIGVVSEDNRGLYLISSEYDYNEADNWVKENVILKAYTNIVSGDNRNRHDSRNFHKFYGLPIRDIAKNVIEWIGNDTDVSFYGYYSDYDWVLFCSMFGRMIHLPKGFPMYCRDLKQTFDEAQARYPNEDLKKREGYPIQSNEHIALHDAAWNKRLYEFIIKL